MNANWTQEEQEYMDYLDDIYPGLPCGGAGLLIAKGDPTAFEVGLGEFRARVNHEKEEENAP
jgi:hypothetical protein